MYLLELAIHNVRGFLPTSRAGLKPGYLVLRPVAPEMPPLSAVLRSVLYPDAPGTDASLLAQGQERGRLGITLYGNDQGTYRVVREVGADAPATIHRFNKAAQAFEPLADDPLGLADLLENHVGLPRLAAFEALHTFTVQQLPSRAGAEPQAAPGSVQALEGELRVAKQVERKQAEFDTLEREVYELESQSQDLSAARQAVAEAKHAVDQAPTLATLGLPSDTLERLERFPQAVARRDEALARLDAERPPEEEEEEEPSSAAGTPFWQDARFWGAAALGLAIMVGGLMMEGAGKYLALLDIPLFGIAAFVAFQYVDGLEHAERRGRKGGMRAAREKKIHEEFEAEARPVSAALSTAGVESHEELAQLLGQRAGWEARLEAAAAQLRALQADPRQGAALRKLEAQSQRRDALAAELAELAGGYVRPPFEIQRELREAKAAGAPAASGADPLPALLQLAAELMGAEVTTVATMVRDRAAQYFTALCDRRYTGLEAAAGGRLRPVSASGAVDAGSIAPGDLDLLFLAVRLTLIEKMSAQVKVPVVIEGELGVDDSKLPLLSRMLKHLGTVTQVVHLTAHPAFGQVADVTGKI